MVGTHPGFSLVLALPGTRPSGLEPIRTGSAPLMGQIYR